MTDPRLTPERIAELIGELDRTLAESKKWSGPNDRAVRCRETILALIAERETSALFVAAWHAVNHGAFPVHTMLRVLSDAAKHLLDDHDCDFHGHEVVRYNATAAAEAAVRLETVADAPNAWLDTHAKLTAENERLRAVADALIADGVIMSPEASAKLDDLMANPPPPTDRLRELLRARKAART